MTCVDCGKEITGAANKLRCDECVYKHRLEYYANRRKEAKEKKEPKPPTIKYCVDCGVQLPIGCCVRQKRCTVCRDRRKRETDRLCAKRRKLKIVKKPSTLIDIVREAAEHGMSYGQWVARR